MSWVAGPGPRFSARVASLLGLDSTMSIQISIFFSLHILYLGPRATSSLFLGRLENLYLDNTLKIRKPEIGIAVKGGGAGWLAKTHFCWISNLCPLCY